jgi:NAD-dependent dihydropyrimidine dehydrogenase PreA subunit
MAFIHLVGLPIVLVLGIWFHLLRVRMPRINPPRMLMAGSLAALLALSLAVPAVSHAPADLGIVPTELRIDWYYLAIYPLLDLSSEGIMWAGLWGVSLFLCALPWLPPMKHPPAAVVHLPDCTGCEFCAEDCPYGAIEMVPRTDERNFKLQAQVDPAVRQLRNLHRLLPLLLALPQAGSAALRHRAALPQHGGTQAPPARGRIGSLGFRAARRAGRLRLQRARGRAGAAGHRDLSLPCAGMMPPFSDRLPAARRRRRRRGADRL